MLSARVGPSAHGGVGLFSICKMKKGDIVCKCACSEMSEERSELHDKSEYVRDTIYQVFDGYVPHSTMDAIPLVCFINHSKKPNCVYDVDSHTIKTLRAIKENVELTADYTKYLSSDSPNYLFAMSGFKTKPW